MNGLIIKIIAIAPMLSCTACAVNVYPFMAAFGSLPLFWSLTGFLKKDGWKLKNKIEEVGKSKTISGCSILITPSKWWFEGSEKYIKSLPHSSDIKVLMDGAECEFKVVKSGIRVWPRSKGSSVSNIGSFNKLVIKSESMESKGVKIFSFESKEKIKWLNSSPVKCC